MHSSSVEKGELPQDSVLWPRIGNGDFLDSYAVASDIPPRQAGEIIAAFPGWAQMLLHVRRVVTTPFGLSNDGPDADDKLGIFPVEIETPHEIVAGFNDRHLDFRVSVMSQQGVVRLSTWVHPHNIGGWLYLRVILPFHILIVRDALKRVQQTT